MRSLEEYAAVLRLVSVGLNDCEVSRRTGVPRSTVRGWRTGQQRTAAPETHGRSCDRCGHPAHDAGALPAADYAYLLGLYLGDGCIVAFPRKVFRLTIALDLRYPGIIASCAAAIEAVSGKVPGFNPSVGCVYVNAYWRAWPCLFPQHGPGRKHEREIQLVDWQQSVVDAEPEALLRGLIHSDGWRGMNRVVARGKRYEYPRYNFCNVSADIRRIFCDACDAVGVEWRQMNRWNISVARRGSVALLDTFIGPKR